MPLTTDQLEQIFEEYAVKTVSKTDVDKAAYLPDKDQREKVFERLGYEPVPVEENVTVDLISLPEGDIYTATYYGTQRRGSGRPPEPRMGRFIDYIDPGDSLAFATDGQRVYMAKVDDDEDKNEEQSENEVVRSLQKMDYDYLSRRARNTNGQPRRRQVQRTEFERSLEVKAYVLNRADGECERGGCDYTGFAMDDGTPYLEVHHVTPLSEGGDDTVDNAVGLCANCHRKAHYAQNREEIKNALKQFLEIVED